MTNGKDLRGTWPQALASLIGSVAMILAIRWAFFEPYVIPSGSMIPTLLVHDHILVNKLAYGVRVPFTSSWLVHFGLPNRGDVVVFKSVEDSGVFIVKRVIGLPGDEIKIVGHGQLVINGKPVARRELSRDEIEAKIKEWPEDTRVEYVERYEFFDEQIGEVEHIALRLKDPADKEQGPYKVPADSLFMMGDNRDNSSDSRVWGVLPVERVLGRASSIWMSCEETLPEATQLCDPKTMRWHRMLKGIR
jgi:signal peptidase I